MALVLNNLKRVDMPLNKQTKPNLNDKSNSYLNPLTGSYSVIDLSLCDPITYMDYECKVHNDLCSSDHFPIILESLQPLHEDKLPHWKIIKANWQAFETICQQKLLKDLNIIDQTKHFTKTLTSIANETTAKTPASNKHSTLWFNDDYRTAICRRKAAQWKFDNEANTTSTLSKF